MNLNPRFPLIVLLLGACSASTTTTPETDKLPIGKGDQAGRAASLANAGCPAPMIRVESESACLQDASCYRMEDGDDVYFCTGDDPTVPECRGDLWRVEDVSGCLQDDAFCERTVRGEEVYYCTGPAPLCPEGYHEVPAPTDTSVSRWDQDGVERFCDLDDSFCDEGLARVEDVSDCLQDDAFCIRVDAHEGTYYCTGPAPQSAS